ncbi:hypothetical protein JAAARDRAFT_295093 [Jaapia argillacea MUCL 33604]|uniref:Uncharacterized protein n=1 Tax=Jaapia argillacea MUCL 33604 TaxID=933084 RepID=A0A067PP26_9AGAM|nr:hypothetical protein JAAARDRAFT_295093 [Jaapia argillacea MUCL 33604]
MHEVEPFVPPTATRREIPSLTSHNPLSSGGLGTHHTPRRFLDGSSISAFARILLFVVAGVLVSIGHHLFYHSNHTKFADGISTVASFIPTTSRVRRQRLHIRCQTQRRLDDIRLRALVQCFAFKSDLCSS